jgi:anti-sigma regulatory factor (Ser/Thr protein kinase)
MSEEITAPADREGVLSILGLLDEVLARAKITEPALSEVHLAVDEAVVNILSYSNAKDISLLIDITGDTIKIVISDDGIPFDPLHAPLPDTDAPLEEREPGGLGIFLIRESMDEVSYKYHGGKNIFNMIKRRNPTITGPGGGIDRSNDFS